MRQRLAAVRNRFRLSERGSNRFWMGVIIFAILLPVVATAYETLRQNPLAGILFVLLIVIWGAVMWWGWRQPRTQPTDGQSASAPPVQPVNPPTRGRRTNR